MPTTMPIDAPTALFERLASVQRSLLVRQNLALFAGGLVAGVGSFVYHAIAGRVLGPAAYGQVASLIAAFGIGLTIALVISLVLARHTATLMATGMQGIGSLLGRAVALVAIPGIGVMLLTTLAASQIAGFEHLTSSAPVVIIGVAIAVGWQVAIPRGILQGLQRFKSLAVNLALEPTLRVVALAALLAGGFSVSGAVAAVVVGLGAAFVIGIYTIRDSSGGAGASTRPNFAGSFSLTAVAAVVGIQLLFNQDVVLAEHYLPSHQGGIYGALNKIGTIMFYLTLSVGQVLFPRVVDAVARQQNPVRLLVSSVGLVSVLGVGALSVFAIAPGVVVDLLYGPSFREATPYVLAIGVIGLAVSLNNLLVQFFLAVHDFWFVPILAVGCIAEAGSIVLFHAEVTQVLSDVLTAVVGLLVLLTVRSYVLLTNLRASEPIQHGVKNQP